MNVRREYFTDRAFFPLTLAFGLLFCIQESVFTLFWYKLLLLFSSTNIVLSQIKREEIKDDTIVIKESQITKGPEAVSGPA